MTEATKSQLEMNENSELFKLCSGCRHYVRIKNPFTVLYAGDMGEGSYDSRLESALNHQAVQSFIVSEWEHFHHHAEKNFTYNFATAFWPGWFELRCSNLLRLCGYKNMATGGGPDFLLAKASENINSFALEATVLSSGVVGGSTVTECRSPEIVGEFVVVDVSEKKSSVDSQGKRRETKNCNSQWNMSLRVTNTLQNKRDQINKWHSCNVIGESLPVVVAISPAQLEFETNRSFQTDDMERALYGKGNRLLRIRSDVNTLAEQKAPIYRGAQTMENNNAANVPLGLFLDGDYACISAVLLVEGGLFPSSTCEIQLYLNPHASVPFDQVLPFVDNYVSYNSGILTTRSADH